MGVPGLQTWLKRRYGAAFVPLPDQPFDHVYIDMSNILHQVIRRGRAAARGGRAAAAAAACMRAGCRHGWVLPSLPLLPPTGPSCCRPSPRPRPAARTKQYFHQLLHRQLDDILRAARPQRRVVLALDGPAPLAKLLEQR